MRASLLLLIFLFVSATSWSQSEDSESSSKAYSPTIGIGVGSIGFYGDLNDRDYGSPIKNNAAVNLYLIQPATSYLNVRFEFMLGKLREEERSRQRNVNFESDIRAGALLFEYNFDHFLPKERKVTPFIATGIEAVEYNPKTDLLAYNGEPYNYWRDGSIRNLPENSPQADQAVIIRRDYSYETDIREAGFNGSTDYLERAFAIPVNAGVTMHLNSQFNFRVQSTIHFTFTDYIDGITPSTSQAYVDQKAGNSRNDFFVVSGVSLSYNFQKVEAAEPFERFDDAPIDYRNSGNTEDFDQDGVIDLIDNCPNTPRGIQVDTLGCPVDTDKDGIPDYKDEEINTEYPEFANAQGVEMSDEMIYKSYLQYIDSTLEYAEVIERDFTGGKKKNRVSYRVKIEEHEKGSNPEDMSKLLSLSDLAKIDQGNKTVYTVGNYSTLTAAENRAAQMKQKGFDNSAVLQRNTNGDYLPVSNEVPRVEENREATKDESQNKAPAKSEEATETNNESVTTTTATEEQKEEVVFRVQLGAFKNEPTEEAFRSIPNLFVVESGGYYRYMSGAFDNFEDAAKHKVKMVVKGYKGSFVVAYKKGKRVTLKSVGINPISSDPIIGK
ncbi:MAG: DUF6089 family protein [Vicingaceae bacterium]